MDYCSLDQYITYEAQRGDTLSNITLRYYGSIEAWEVLSEIT
jgi:nucleoid-associated protein YgaU